jgi:Aph-1 protein
MTGQSALSMPMTALCIIIAFGAPIYFFFRHVYSKSHLIALFMVSSISSLLGFFVVSVFWKLLENVIAIGFMALIGSLIQECCRFLLIRCLYRKLESTYMRSIVSAGIKGKTIDFRLDDVGSSLAAGIGFGFMKSLIIYGNTLSVHLRASSVDADQTVLVTELIGLASISLSYFLLDLVLMPVAFAAEKRNNFKVIGTVICLRLSATACMFFSGLQNGQFISLGGIFLIFCASSITYRRVLPSAASDSSLWNLI